MLFLINNPVILFIVVVIVGFMLYMATKIVNEIKLNQQLQQKHAAMRIKDPARNITKRIGILGSTALAPVLVFVA